MNELLELELDEVSLVDAPANKSATVTLFKRETPMEEENKIEEDLIKGDETLEEGTSEDGEKKTRKSYKAEAEALAVEVETLKGEVESLKEALAKKDEVEKSEEMIDFDGEMVAKSAIPAVVLKRLEEVEKAREAEELRKRARDVLPNFKGTEDQRGQLLKAAEKLPEAEAILEALKAADALFAAAFSEVGKSDLTGEMKSAGEKLDDLAKAYSVEKGVSYHQGYAAVIKTAEGKALLKEVNKK